MIYGNNFLILSHHNGPIFYIVSSLGLYCNNKPINNMEINGLLTSQTHYTVCWIVSTSATIVLWWDKMEAGWSMSGIYWLIGSNIIFSSDKVTLPLHLSDQQFYCILRWTYIRGLTVLYHYSSWASLLLFWSLIKSADIWVTFILMKYRKACVLINSRWGSIFHL